MKEFFVGLLFLIAVVILTGVGFLLLPFLLILTVFLRIFVGFLLVIFAIWLLGKLIVLLWEFLNRKTPAS